MFPITDTSYLHLPDKSAWFAAADLLSNAYFPWRLNPALSALGRTPLAYCTVLFLISLLGSYLLGTAVKAPRSSFIAASLVAWLGVLGLFGVNIPLLSTLSLFFLVTGFFCFCVSLTGTQRLAGAAIVGLFGLFTASQLMLPVVIGGLLAAAAFKLKPQFSVIVILLAISLYPIAFPAPCPFPDYPAEARLVPGYGTPFGLDPLIGYKPLRPVIDKEFTQGTLAYPSLALFLTSLLLLIKRRDELLIGTVLVSGAVLLDSSIFPEAVRLLSPVQSISRIIPGYAFLPVNSLFLTLAVAFFAAGILNRESTSRVRIAHSIAPLLFFLFSKLPVSPFGEIAAPVTDLGIHARLYESPSLYIMTHAAPLLLQTPKGTPTVLAALKPTMTGSHNSNDLPNLLDTNRASRWCSKLAKQTGDEWIQLSFQTPITITGIDLSVPQFSSDYPRGVLISSGTAKGSACVDAKTAFSVERWLGSVLFTEKGYPYFSSESTVRIPFTPVTTNCLKIQQIGRSASYEWSVEALTLLTLPSAS